MSNSTPFTSRFSPFSVLPAFSGRRLATSALALPLLMGGCNQHPLDEVEMDSTIVDPVSFNFAPQNKVDVLLVVDNSGSMGEEQANLAANFGAFVDTLEDAGADYRIAVTTTDVQNLEWCQTTTPENGKFQSSSCRTRLQHFTDQGGGMDVSTTACMEICDLDGLSLLPTAVEGDENPEVRPWIQTGGADSNLPEGVSGTEAFSCMGPQGIDGCGFESPLEAMRLALIRTDTISEAEFGFLRQDAALMVIIVTDEVDCSTSADGQTIFDPAGNRVFWSDPTSSSPTSAACWNAGVRCTGDAAGYDDCVAVDKAADGSDGNADNAVLRPVQDYIDALDAIQEIKNQSVGKPKRVHVSLIGGVPLDFASVLDVPYSDSSNAAFQGKFGIGAGCTSEIGGVTQEAVPPVRMRELVEAFDREQMFSVCDDDYSASLTDMADTLEPGKQGACANRCLMDTDLAVPGIQPECRIEEEYPDGSKIQLGECEMVGGEWVPAAGEDTCVAYLGDVSMETETLLDDTTDYCDPESSSIAIELHRAEGVPVPADTLIRAVCEGDSRLTGCD